MNGRRDPWQDELLEAERDARFAATFDLDDDRPTAVELARERSDEDAARPWELRAA